jgi:hypothetical protein
MINKRSHEDGDTKMKKYRIQRRIPNKRKLDDNLILLPRSHRLILLPRSQGRNRSFSLQNSEQQLVINTRFLPFHRQEHSQAACHLQLDKTWNYI